MSTRSKIDKWMLGKQLSKNLLKVYRGSSRVQVHGEWCEDAQRLSLALDPNHGEWKGRNIVRNEGTVDTHCEPQKGTRM